MPKTGADRDVNPLAIAKEKCDIEVRFYPYLMDDRRLGVSESGIGLVVEGALALPGDIYSFHKAKQACVQTKLKELKRPESLHLPPLVLENELKLRK